MAEPQDWQPEDQVQAPPHPDPVPLAPAECEADWKACLDAGKERAPTTAHQEEGWRAIPAGGKP